MTLPDILDSAIREVCDEQSLNADDVMRAIQALVGDDTYVDFSVWSGPGFGQENLKLDVYVLGNDCLYNYSVQADLSAGSTVLLDAVSQVGLSKVEDERSPYVLLVIYGNNSGRLFGREADRDRMEVFSRNIIDRCLIVRNSRRPT